MNNHKLLYFLKTFTISILLFFTFSFLSIIPYLIPWNHFDIKDILRIGYPLDYYREFGVDCEVQGGWGHGLALPIDMMFAILSSIILLAIWNKLKSKLH